MAGLSKTLMERGLAEGTANLYITTLYKLNNSKPFGTLAFLKETDQIDNAIKAYAVNTQRSVYSYILSVLKDLRGYKKHYEHYAQKFKLLDEDKKAEDTTVKSEKQEKNWITWKQVLDQRNDYESAVNSFKLNKKITIEEYDTLLCYIVLCLYTMIPPRRNLDYTQMFIVQSITDSLDKDNNYWSVDDGKFVFNTYKTAKKYGTEEVELPDELKSALEIYLKFHPLRKGKITGKSLFRFLVYHDGRPFGNINSMTRILNKIFGKKVGSSMLRHIYLSNKYGNVLQEMAKDSDAMGHTMAQQKEYIKLEGKEAMPDVVKAVMPPEPEAPKNEIIVTKK